VTGYEENPQGKKTSLFWELGALRREGKRLGRTERPTFFFPGGTEGDRHGGKGERNEAVNPPVENGAESQKGLFAVYGTVCNRIKK